MDNANIEKKNRHPDFGVMLVPLVVVGLISATFFIWPEGATNTLYTIRGFINDWFSSWFGLFGIASVAVSIYIAASPLGKIRLGNKKPMSRFQWGAIVFTTAFGADAIIYGGCEWTFYMDDPYVASLPGSLQDWVPAMSLFHWGPTVWSFLLVMAAAFAYMMHIRNTESRKLSEACRGILGRHVDGPWGHLIDLFTVFAVYASINTCLLICVPGIGDAVGALFGISSGTGLYIALMLILCLIYAVSAWIGMKSISWFSSVCVWLFGILLVYVFLFGGRTTYLLETAITSTGTFLQHFVQLSTQLDPLRTTSFPQNWTLFYWSYWITWTVGPPFFIAQISGGRTIRQVILEGYAWGVAGGWVTFFVLGNYGMSLQLIDGMPLSAEMLAGVPVSAIFIEILRTLPLSRIVIPLTTVVMILQTTTLMDSTTLIVGAFSEPYLKPDELPSRKVRLFWAILMIVLPIALLFAQGSLNNIQSVAIIAALPLSVLLIIAVVGFIKEGRAYIRKGGTEPHNS